MKNLFLVSLLCAMLFSLAIVASCDSTTGFTNPTPRTISTFKLLAPSDSSVVTLTPSDSLDFIWELPTDVGSISSYTLILDKDDTLENGRVLTYELPNTDSLGQIVDTVFVYDKRRFSLTYSFLREIPAINPPIDTLLADSLFYTVQVRTTFGSVFRSTNFFRFTLILQ